MSGFSTWLCVRNVWGRVCCGNIPGRKSCRLLLIFAVHWVVPFRVRMASALLTALLSCLGTCTYRAELTDDVVCGAAAEVRSLWVAFISAASDHLPHRRLLTPRSSTSLCLGLFTLCSVTISCCGVLLSRGRVKLAEQPVPKGMWMTCSSASTMPTSRAFTFGTERRAVSCPSLWHCMHGFRTALNACKHCCTPLGLQ
jgi:hypothetical protein